MTSASDLLMSCLWPDMLRVVYSMKRLPSGESPFSPTGCHSASTHVSVCSEANRRSNAASFAVGGRSYVVVLRACESV